MLPDLANRLGMKDRWLRVEKFDGLNMLGLLFACVHGPRSLNANVLRTLGLQQLIHKHAGIDGTVVWPNQHGHAWVNVFQRQRTVLLDVQRPLNGQRKFLGHGTRTHGKGECAQNHGANKVVHGAKFGRANLRDNP